MTQALHATSTPAPHGERERTVLDTRVRPTGEMATQRLVLRWAPGALAELPSRASLTLGLSQLAARLHSLLVLPSCRRGATDCCAAACPAARIGCCCGTMSAPNMVCADRCCAVRRSRRTGPGFSARAGTDPAEPDRHAAAFGPSPRQLGQASARRIDRRKLAAGLLGRRQRPPPTWPGNAGRTFKSRRLHRFARRLPCR